MEVVGYLEFLARVMVMEMRKPAVVADEYLSYKDKACPKRRKNLR